MVTTTEVFDKNGLASLIAAATILGTDLKAGLYTNPLSPTKKSVLADLTEPLYGSYVQQAVVMGVPFRDPALGICSLSAALLWQETGTPLSVIIQGIFYVTGGTPYLLGIEPFPTPIPLNDLLDAFSTQLQYIQSSPTPALTVITR